MTIRELYQWAEENEALNKRIEIQCWDYDPDNMEAGIMTFSPYPENIEEYNGFILINTTDE